MAAAEARAVWQRTANRCFVQEDAKRAPKLACCQSSSSTTRQVDAGPATVAEGPDHPATGFMPINRNPSYSSLPPDTRWWLQMQPSYGYQKDFTYEQLSALEADMETLRAGFVKSTPKTSEVHQQKAEFTDAVSAVCMKTGYEAQKQDVSAKYSKNMQEPLQYEMKEKYETMGMDTIDCPVSNQPKEFCCDYPWIGGGRAEPWWRTTDRDELASLVAQKSLNHMENCDLPPPQKTYHKRHPYADIGCSDPNVILGTSLDAKAQATSLSSMTTPAHGYPDSGRGEMSGEGHSDKSFRDITEIQQLSEGEPTKAQLMEALCHSQTRAREAEKAAKQAYAEKEHIFKLFFTQASQLFAYKQWFQLLQLESLYLQIKNNEQPPSATVFPEGLPWMPVKGKKLRRNWRKGAKGKRGRMAEPRHDIATYAVAFALGFGLVGAGLFLGWTVGWMLPHF
ncbi:hypothetical protein C1H46_023009 [Malus baccata]|uniref:Uncharacterized protein n=1 Tax=Malus baccata TaxID=106549 RepID=A0A540LYJ7_MALBA|nr:hypothetical protein C1H46_023009 [Malus baccata]